MLQSYQITNWLKADDFALKYNDKSLISLPRSLWSHRHKYLTEPSHCYAQHPGAIFDSKCLELSMEIPTMFDPGLIS